MMGVGANFGEAFAQGADCRATPAAGTGTVFHQRERSPQAGAVGWRASRGVRFQLVAPRTSAVFARGRTGVQVVFKVNEAAPTRWTC